MEHKIKTIAKEKGLSIAELERAADLRPGTISNWGEPRNCMPAADKLYRVAKVLETTVEALLEDE